MSKAASRGPRHPNPARERHHRPAHQADATLRETSRAIEYFRLNIKAAPTAREWWSLALQLAAAARHCIAQSFKAKSAAARAADLDGAKREARRENHDQAKREADELAAEMERMPMGMGLHL